MRDGKGVNFKDVLTLTKNNILPLVTQALPQEVKSNQGTLNPLIQLKNQIYN
jgi:hypothetical protein